MTWLVWAARCAAPALLFAIGCGDDSVSAEEPSPSNDSGVLDAASHDADSADAADTEDAAVSNGGCTGVLQACDIREPDCQRTISEEVACLRGGEPVMPGVRLVSPAAWAELVDQPIRHDARKTLWYQGLASFELMSTETTPSERADDESSQSAAVYLPAAREVVIVDRGMAIDTIDAVAVLAHELVHAYQEEERSSNTWTAEHATSYDRMLAAISVVEGEASHYEQLVALSLLGIQHDDFDWDALYERWQGETYRISDQVEGPFATTRFLLPYAFGAELAKNAWLRDGQDGIDALYEAPPQSSRELMTGNADGEAEAQDALYQAALPDFSAEYVPIAFDALGAFNARAFLVRHGLSEASALAAAETVAADIFSVQSTPDGSKVVSTWRLQLLDTGEPPWLAELDPLEGFAVLLGESQVTFIQGPPDVLAQVPLFNWVEVPPLPVFPGGS